MTEVKIGFIKKLNCIKLKEFLRRVNSIEEDAPEEFKDQIELEFTEDDLGGTIINFYYNRPETAEELKKKENHLNKIKEAQERFERAEFERLSKKFAKTT